VIGLICGQKSKAGLANADRRRITGDQAVQARVNTGRLNRLLHIKFMNGSLDQHRTGRLGTGRYRNTFKTSQNHF